jgi:hypothetical protein
MRAMRLALPFSFLLWLSCGAPPMVTPAPDGGQYVGFSDTSGPLAFEGKMPRASFRRLPDGGADPATVFVQLANTNLCPPTGTTDLAVLDLSVDSFERSAIGPGTYAVTDQLAALDGGSYFRGPGIVLMTFVHPDRSVRHLEAASGEIVLTTVQADRVSGSLSVSIKLEDGGLAPLQAEFDAPVCSGLMAGQPAHGP